MRISPHYDAIKSRALQTLHSDRLLMISGCNTLEELCRHENKLSLWNAVGCALIFARDDIEYETRDYGSFNKGNFAKAEREITRLLKVEHGSSRRGGLHK